MCRYRADRIRASPDSKLRIDVGVDVVTQQDRVHGGQPAASDQIVSGGGDGTKGSKLGDGPSITGDGELLARDHPIEHPPTVVA